MNDLTLYNSAKDQMQTGDLLLWRSHSLLGKLIRDFSHAPVNHASLIMRIEAYEGAEGRRFIAEALEHGIVLNLLSKRLQDEDAEAWWYPLNDEWAKKRAEIGERALSFMGTPYDYDALFKLAIGKVQSNTDKLICSEFYFASLGMIGPIPTPGELPEMGILKEGVRILWKT
jgi:hypothetical protein